MRQQGQQSSPTPTPATHVSGSRDSTTVKKSASKGSQVKASEGIRAFMASKRAAAQQQRKTTTTTPSSPRNRVMTGADRYTFDDEDAFGQSSTKPNLKIQTIIKQAKSSGKLNISNRELDKIPEEVWSMYHVDPNKIVVDFSSSGDAWYDSTELNKFIATDNEITELDERIGTEFGALTLIDMRNNRLSTLPDTLNQLNQLTVLHLSHNAFESIPSSVFDLVKLRDLDLAHNKLNVLPADIGRLSQLEILNLNDNNLQEMADDVGQLHKLRKLYLSENQLVELPAVDSLSGLQKLEELHVSNNQLRVLFKGSATAEVALPKLTRLDAHQNSMTTLADEGCSKMVSLPNLKEILLAYNQLSDDTSILLLNHAPEIQTLDISSNIFSDIPSTVYELRELIRLDVSANHLRVLCPDLGKLEHLAVINWEGNPLRSVPRNVTMVELIESLRSKMTLEDEKDKEAANDETTTNDVDAGGLVAADNSDELKSDEPAPPVVRASGTLDLSNQQLDDVTHDALSQSNMTPATLQLHHNRLQDIPATLDVFANTLVHLHLQHNRISQLSLTSFPIFASLKTLSLANNRIASIEITPEAETMFPKLVELDLSFNALTILPEDLTAHLPSLRTLRANTNQISKISAKSLENLEIIDLANNDIAYLPPEIGRIRSIKELMLYGNRFRIPRPTVLDQGTQAVLEFLRRRLG
ncbi:L domain-like protein, partial [Lichtheimia hyalospora FSU 10163]